MNFIPLFGWWLIFLLVIILLFFIWTPILRSKKRQRQVIYLWLRRSVLLAVIVLLMAGPSIVITTRAPGITNVDVLVMVDTTASMGALDYVDERMRVEGVKHDLMALATEMQGANFAIITFDSKADLLLPFTHDSSTLSMAIKSINREIYRISNGSRIDEPVKLAEQILKNSHKTRPEHSRIVFYVGDGEQTASADVGSFKPLEQYVNGGGVLGYGTTEGARILKYAGIIGGNLDPAKEDSYVQYLNPDTKAFEAAISKRDEIALQRAAQEIGVSYFDRNTGGDIAELLTQSRTIQIVDDGREIQQFLNLYWLLATIVVLLLSWEWKLVISHYSTLRTAKGPRS